MRMMMTAALAALLATGALAADKFKAGGVGGSLSASGFVSGGQPGNWTVGAMNESYGGAKVFGGNGTTEATTWGGSASEGFGQNFRGGVAAGGAGGGFGGFKARGRF